MKKNYSLVFILFLCFGLSGYGQVKIDEITFETVGGYTTSIPEFSDGSEDYFTRTDGSSNISGTQMVFANKQGTYFFAAHDTNGDGGPNTLSLNFDNINVSGYTNLQLRIHIAEDDDGSNQDWDGDSYMHITGIIDTSSSQNILWVEAASGTNSEPRLDSNFNGIGNGTAITDTFTQFVANISGTGNSLDIQIEFNDLNDGDEDIAIDNIEIWGVSSLPCIAPITQPTSLVLNNITSASIDGSFIPTTADEYLVVASTSPTLGANPVNGTSYSNGDPLGSGTVIQSSNTTTFTATGLSQTTQYYFFVFAQNNSSCTGGPVYNTTNPLTGNSTTLTGPCLEEGFEGGTSNPTGWTNNDSYYNIGDANNGSYKAGMNDNNDWIRTEQLTDPSDLSFWARASGGSSNYTITIQYSPDGVAWFDSSQIFANGSNTGDITTTYQQFNYNLNLTGNYYIRWFMSPRSSGSFYFDDVEVFCGTSTPEPELQLVDNTSTNQNCGYTIDYGSVGIGSTSDLTFEIENIGSLDLTVSSFGITGDYTIVSPAPPLTITSGNSQTVTLRFTPVSDGTSTGALTINNDDIDEGTCIVNLTGVGFTPGPNINVRGVIGSIPTIANGSITTSSLNNTYFAQQTINTTSQTKTFRIGNEGGTANLNVSSITLSGNTADFFVTSSFTNPFAIDTFQDFTITFQPTTLSGLRSVTVSIANTDSTKDPYTFVVEGIANCAAVSGSISPTEGPAGTTVTIVSPGNDLTGATADLNGVTLTPVSDSTLELVVRLPNTILSGGPLSIELSNGCVFSSTFTLIDNTIAGCQTTSSAVVSDLFISEITDSPSGSLTYIELYNATGSLINFATTNYSIRIYNNGSTSTFNDLILDSGTVASGSTYVISCGTNDAQCPVTGGDGSLAQVNLATIGASINFFRSGNQNIGHDYIGLYSTAAISVSNPTGNIDSWGSFGDQTWATGLGLGDKGANFQRDTNATFPNTTFSTADWIITDWTDADCSDVDYSTIGAFDFSTGLPPTITLQPIAPAFECTFSASLTISGTEGYDGPTPADTQNLAYQWYFNQPGTSTWTEISPANPNYTGQQTATLNIIDTMNLDGYQYYCQLREDSDTCFEASNAVKLDVRVSIWDGTWSVPPAIDRFALIDDNYDTSEITNGEISFEACGCTITNNHELFISDNDFVRIDNNLVVDGSLVVRPYGSFVQVDDLGTITGNILSNKSKIQVIKKTALLNSSQEYTYWSSPVSGEIVSDGLAEANLNRVFSFSGENFLDATRELNNNNGTLPGQDDIDDDNNDWQAVTGATVMLPGTGYAATQGFAPSFPTQLDYIFEGPFNNGVYNVPIYRNDSETNDNNWNFIGNPYPSAIDVVSFLGANASIDQNAAGSIYGAIFFWSHNTVADGNTNGNEALNYAQSDYAIMNGSGATMGGDMIMPNPYIPSGQGFFVSMDDSAPSTLVGGNIRTTDVIFNNSMRVTENNNQFFRSASNATNKLWLNLTTDNGVFNQILIAYINGATDANDGMYFDAERQLSTETNAAIFSLLENSNAFKFAIQGKNPDHLNLEEIIPLGFNTSIDSPTLYTISIYQFEGEFLTENNIYLKDNYLNTYNNLSTSDYTFTSESGDFNDRFEIVFTTTTLSIDDNFINANALTIVELPNGDVEFKLNSNKNVISKVEILDALGRRVYNLKGSNATEVYNLSQLSQSAYIAKITLSNGQVISKKAIKQR
ncbi:choice-of-anchor D domain-containing protein [Winogradskyella schleiferi]|uniref:choice-of-anchor D domain-containing protein n=1 Tax=Winogradskyella schleiferi TaxID=2686078 RepID=UPI0015BDB290|nr:choice-of-anchor D domain-containing protein [Winogradskyella schleiferi]